MPPQPAALGSYQSGRRYKSLQAVLMSMTWQEDHGGCCCEACTRAPRLLRPPKAQGHYGPWHAAAAVAGSDSEDDTAVRYSGLWVGELVVAAQRYISTSIGVNMVLMYGQTLAAQHAGAMHWCADSCIVSCCLI